MLVEDMITLTQLEYVIAVDEHRHFATAAERCCVTQPTLSMQIKKLEEDLGVVIFDRSRQPVVPTDIGGRLIEQARLVIAATRRMEEIINEDRQEVAGSLKIGIIPTLAPYLLPIFIGDYIRKYPAVKVEVEELVSEEIIRRLKRDTLDAGIFVTPYRDDKIVGRPVFYEQMLVYAHPGHELLRKRTLEVADIATPELWMLGDGHCFRDQVVNLCAARETQHKDLPFEFRVSDATVVELSDSGRVQRLVGVNILYPELGAKLYCSYFPVTPASLRIAEAECRSFVARQAKPTDRIAEKAYSNPDAEVYASLFLIEGESASPIQFMLTDSVSRFFRAALYFNCKPNADSLAPAVAYIRRDIVELIQSFSWRE